MSKTWGLKCRTVSRLERYCATVKPPTTKSSVTWHMKLWIWNQRRTSGECEGSHDPAGLCAGCRGRSGSFAACENGRAETEASEGAEQTEAVVFISAVGTNHLGQLSGERHLPPDGTQAVRVLGILGRVEEKKTNERQDTDKHHCGSGLKTSISCVLDEALQHKWFRTLTTYRKHELVLPEGIILCKSAPEILYINDLLMFKIGFIYLKNWHI